jgi:hypothetical protein
MFISYNKVQLTLSTQDRRLDAERRYRCGADRPAGGSTAKRESCMTDHTAGRSTQNSLKGKIALVTGASKRIGRTLAIALAEEGVHIVAHDRRSLEMEIARVCGEVEDCGAKSWKVIADLEKPEEYETLVAQALTAAGSLDILINNASIFLPNTLMDVGFGDLTSPA